MKKDDNPHLTKTEKYRRKREEIIRLHREGYGCRDIKRKVGTSHIYILRIIEEIRTGFKPYHTTCPVCGKKVLQKGIRKEVYCGLKCLRKNQARWKLSPIIQKTLLEHEKVEKIIYPKEVTLYTPKPRHINKKK